MNVAIVAQEGPAGANAATDHPNAGMAAREIAVAGGVRAEAIVVRDRARVRDKDVGAHNLEVRVAKNAANPWHRCQTWK